MMEILDRDHIHNFLNLVTGFGVLVLTFLMLFFFWNLTTESYEIPKFLILAIFVSLLFILSAIKSVAAGKITLTVTPLHVPLLLLAFVALASTFLAASPYPSIFGPVNKLSASLSTLVTVIIFFYLAVNNIKLRQVDRIIGFLTISAGALAVLSLLSYFGINILPVPGTGNLNFTPTGSSFNTTATLALLIPFQLLAIIKSPSAPIRLTAAICLTLFGMALALIGSLSTISAAVLAVILTSAVAASPASVRKNLWYLLTPIVAIVIITGLSFTPPISLFAPIGISQIPNPVYKATRNFPREIQLDFATSWKVAVSAFRDAPFWGTGPGTFVFNFTQYKPNQFNSTRFWQIKYDLAFNEYLQMLGTLGGLGVALLLLTTANFIKSSYGTVTNPGFYTDYFKEGLAISGLVFFSLLTLHAATLVVWIIGLLLLSLFYISHSHLTKQFDIKLAGDFGLSLLPILLLGLLMVTVVVSTFYIGKFVKADFYHKKALVAIAENKGLDAYNELVMAEKFNPYADLYRTNLAQTNFALATAIATQKGPTKDAPGGSLSDEDKKNISQLLSQAITEGKVAVTLSPRNAANWEVLGSIYRNISGVAQNALQFSLDAYGQAIQKDPLNPALRVSIGGIYYSSKDYDSAIRFFADAINLKPDYANGYYNLSAALRDKGDLTRAQDVAEKLVSLLKPQSPDYQVATTYLADLKARIATGSAQQSAITPAKPESIFQQNSLPEVLDLPKPDSMATPPAVKK